MKAIRRKKKALVQQWQEQQAIIKKGSPRAKRNKTMTGSKRGPQATKSSPRNQPSIQNFFESKFEKPNVDGMPKIIGTSLPTKRLARKVCLSFSMLLTKLICVLQAKKTLIAEEEDEDSEEVLKPTKRRRESDEDSEEGLKPTKRRRESDEDSEEVFKPTKRRRERRESDVSATAKRERT